MSFLLLHLVTAEEVGGPVDNVKEGKHQREGDAGNDVDTFGPCGELGEPRAAAVFALRLHVNLALTRLLHRQGLLKRR